MTDKVLQKTIFLRATPDTVWDYLTNPDRLAEWFHKPNQPLTEGQKLEMYGTTSGDRLISGEVRAARRPEYLEYTFTIKPMAGAVSVVKWTLTPVSGGTRLELLHEGLPQSAEAFGMILALDNGWDEHFLKLRATVHETLDA